MSFEGKCLCLSSQFLNTGEHCRGGKHSRFLGIGKKAHQSPRIHSVSLSRDCGCSKIIGHNNFSGMSVFNECFMSGRDRLWFWIIHSWFAGFGAILFRWKDHVVEWRCHATTWILRCLNGASLLTPPSWALHRLELSARIYPSGSTMPSFLRVLSWSLGLMVSSQGSQLSSMFFLWSRSTWGVLSPVECSWNLMACPRGHCHCKNGNNWTEFYFVLQMFSQFL